MKIEFNDYEKRAETRWGDTAAFQEYKERSKNLSAEEFEPRITELMTTFSKFKALDCGPCDEEAQALVHQIQALINRHFYTCTDEILAGLGKMYVADPEFKNNIDGYAGEGTAEFVSKAIEFYCNR